MNNLEIIAPQSIFGLSVESLKLSLDSWDTFWRSEVARVTRLSVSRLWSNLNDAQLIEAAEAGVSKAEYSAYNVFLKFTLEPDKGTLGRFWHCPIRQKAYTDMISHASTFIDFIDEKLIKKVSRSLHVLGWMGSQLSSKIINRGLLKIDRWLLKIQQEAKTLRKAEAVLKVSPTEVYEAGGRYKPGMRNGKLYVESEVIEAAGVTDDQLESLSNIAKSDFEFRPSFEPLVQKAVKGSTQDKHDKIVFNKKILSALKVSFNCAVLNLEMPSLENLIDYLETELLIEAVETRLNLELLYEQFELSKARYSGVTKWNSFNETMAKLGLAEYGLD